MNILRKTFITLGISFVFMAVLVIPSFSSNVAHAQDYNYEWGITDWLTNNPGYYPGVLDKYGYNSRHMPPRFYVSEHGTEFRDTYAPLDPMYTPYSYDEALNDSNTCAAAANGYNKSVKGWYLTPSSPRKWDTDGVNSGVHQGWEYWDVGWKRGDIVNHYMRWASFLYQIPKPTYTGCSPSGYQYNDGAHYWYRVGSTISLNATANDEEGWVRTFRLSILDSGGQGITGYYDFTNKNPNCDGRNGNLFSGINIYKSSDSNTQWAREYYDATTCGEDYYTVYASVDNRSGVLANNGTINTGINIATDGTPPTLPRVSIISGVSGGWTSGNVSFTLSDSVDSRSGLNHYEYNIDGGGWTYYGGTVTISNGGWHTIQARAVDNVGNASGASTVYAGKDTGQPYVYYSPSYCNWQKDDRPVTIIPTDSGSGVYYYKYRFSTDGGNTWGNWSDNLFNGVQNNSGTTVLNGIDYSSVYNYTYYINHNPDVANAFNGDPIATLNHFVSNGMSEGRQASLYFNVSQYRDAYGDLNNAYDNNWKAYYLHYMYNGKAEGRRGTYAAITDGTSSVVLTNQYVNAIQTYVVDNTGITNTVTSGLYYIDKTPPSGSVQLNYDFNDNLQLQASGVNDGTGSGVRNVSVELYDVDNQSNKITKYLTQQDSTSWVLDSTNILSLFPSSYQIQATVYVTDNVGNRTQLKSQVLDILHISASLSPQVAKQGQQITFTVNTVGFPNKLDFNFPNEFQKLDSSIVNNKITVPIAPTNYLTTTYKYTLPLSIPLTLDPHGNRLLTQYPFRIVATRADGHSAYSDLTLDVQNNIYSGFRTVFIN